MGWTVHIGYLMLGLLNSFQMSRCGLPLFIYFGCWILVAAKRRQEEETGCFWQALHVLNTLTRLTQSSLISPQLCRARYRILSQDFIPPLWADQAQGNQNIISPNSQATEGSINKHAHLPVNNRLSLSPPNLSPPAPIIDTVLSSEPLWWASL